MFNPFGATMNSTTDLTVSVIVPVLNEKKIYQRIYRIGFMARF